MSIFKLRKYAKIIVNSNNTITYKNVLYTLFNDFSSRKHKNSSFTARETVIHKVYVVIIIKFLYAILFFASNDISSSKNDI
jgi:hypothetical protein